MGRLKGSKMTEEQKAAMRAKRAANQAGKSTTGKETGNQADPMRAIGDAFKYLFKTIETHGGNAGEEMIDTVRNHISNLSDLTEKKMQDARKKAIEVAEENVRKAQAKLEELHKKYDK